MAATATKVTQLAWDGQAFELLAPSVNASPWSMVSGPRDVLSNAHLFELELRNSHVFLALRGTERERGRLLEVVAMRSVGDRVRAADLVPELEAIARNCYEGVDLLSMVTRRPHLVSGCERMGWTAVATVVNKPLRLQ